MKRKMIVAALSVPALVLLVFVVGLLLPKQREFVKEADIKSSPESVFQLVSDVERQVYWRNDLREIKVIDQDTWTEIPKRGTPITFRIRQKIENKLFHIEIIEPKKFNGFWVGAFEKSPVGTKVVFKEVIIMENPFLRVLSSIFFDLDKSMEAYMNNLKIKLGA
jgi:hypothetical protein